MWALSTRYRRGRFQTLATLMIGRPSGLWEAAMGALRVSLLNRWRSDTENTVRVAFFSVAPADDESDLSLRLIIAGMLLFRLQEVAGTDFSLACAVRLRPRRPPRTERSLTG